MWRILVSRNNHVDEAVNDELLEVCYALLVFLKLISSPLHRAQNEAFDCLCLRFC